MTNYPLTLPPTSLKPVSQGSRGSPIGGLLQQVNANSSLTTKLLVGASLQSLLVVMISDKRYALLPAVLLLVMKTLDTLLITFNLKSNPYLQDVLMGKTTAIIPDEDGQTGDEKRQKVVIFTLGAKSNHPLGLFAPGFIQVGLLLNSMNQEFDSQEPPQGFLGQTNWERKDERGAREFNLISYWRSVEDLHAYSVSPTHKKAWLAWENNLKKYNYLGINHEMYEADAGHWENVYVNFQPTGIGATSVLRRGNRFETGHVGDEWITPLIDAKKGKFAKSSGRLGRPPNKHDAERPVGQDYE